MIELLYVCPRGFFAYEQRLHRCLRSFGDRIAIHRFDHATALARRARFAAFVSTTQPTVVIRRDGAVVVEAIGEVPTSELRWLVGRALDHGTSVRAPGGRIAS